LQTLAMYQARSQSRVVSSGALVVHLGVHGQ
jgi:hypothetical protein